MRLDHLLSKEKHISEITCVTLGQTRVDDDWLFNFEGAGMSGAHSGIFTITQTENRYPLDIWGCSSAGRAPALHAGGQEFDPPHLHSA